MRIYIQMSNAQLKHLKPLKGKRHYLANILDKHLHLHFDTMNTSFLNMPAGWDVIPDGCESFMDTINHIHVYCIAPNSIVNEWSGPITPIGTNAVPSFLKVTQCDEPQQPWWSKFCFNDAIKLYDCNPRKYMLQGDSLVRMNGCVTDTFGWVGHL